MPNRPPIPAEVRREVLIEAGHRCAACGADRPLEFAHIVAWSRSKDHSAQNILCLCANCHQRADIEKWGVKTLRHYKQNPWIRTARVPKVAETPAGASPEPRPPLNQGSPASEDFTGQAAQRVERKAGKGRSYDLFLSYNSADHDTVRQIHEALKARGYQPWFDRESLTPGRLWQEEAEKGLASCRAAAVFVGPNGLGPWENMEMRALLTRVAREGLPLIPVPLPGAPEKLELPSFLSELAWVDLRRGITEEGIAELVRGIPKLKGRTRR